MNELRILFTGVPGQDCRARVVDVGGRRRGAEVPFPSLLAEDDFEDLRWYLEEYLDLPDGGAVVRAQRVERKLEQWGRELYDALFSAEENCALLRGLLAGPEPRRLAIVTKDPALLRLPWELVADDAGFLAQRLSVYRQLEEPQERTLRRAQLPLRILYIVSRPSNAGFIDPRFTAKALLDALAPLGADVQVEFCRPPTLDQMEELLVLRQEAGTPFDIVHFDGHGDFSQEKQVGVLYFEEPADASGTAATDPVSAVAFGALLSRHAIPLVLLEACRTATAGPGAAVGSVATHLIDRGVGSVLAMSHAVHVEATRLLMNCFYGALVRGATLDEAVSAARKALWDDRARWLKAGPDGRGVELQDWFLPQLYHRAGDDALVPAGILHARGEGGARAGFRRPAIGEEDGAFPSPPQFGFQGRARELHELERRFRAARGLVLHAMGGMGKTALATEAAHWWTRSGLFRDGARFLSFEQFMSADRVVQVLGRSLAGMQFEQLPAAEQRRRAIELFQQKSMLLVWDNFESVLPQFNDGADDLASPYTPEERHRLVELFRDLTKRSGNSRLLVICRPADTGLPGTQRYELGGLERADSLWLLASILEREHLTLNDRLSRDKLEPLLRDLDDHPLSLELVGPHLSTMTPEEIRADFGRLLAEFQQKAPEGRNRTLLASLEFSLRHLSPAAREALPWLGLFRGGVFEVLLLEVSQLTPATWEPVRRDLERVALVRTEQGLQIGGRPFLRFHPTLAFAVADPTFAQNPKTRQRFMEVYLDLRQALERMLRGSRSRAALTVLNREEANYHTAVRWAVADREFRVAAELGDTFREYLQRSNLLRQRDIWVQWLKGEVGQQGFTEEAAHYERQHAWTRFTQGDTKGAVDQLQNLIERLRDTTDFEPAFQLALALGTLGKVWDRAGAAAQAIPILRETGSHWKELVEKSGGRTWEELLASPDPAKATIELGNLAATMGDLANALRGAAQYDEALALAEKSVEIQKRKDNQREVAAGYGLSADILREAGRYEEADAHYDLALAVACQVGDKELEGSLLQSQGCLAGSRQQLERANRLYQQALARFGEAGNHGSMMRTYNLLGAVEVSAGRLAEALGWYEKSHDLAVEMGDRPGFGQAANNMGIIWAKKGEANRERGEALAAKQRFEKSRCFMKRSLRVWQALGDKPHEADLWNQLAQIHILLGDLRTAERSAHKARKIREALGLAAVWKDYHTLSEIAQASSDLAAAARWANQRDDLPAELRRRAAEGSGLPSQMLQVLQALILGAKGGGSCLGPAEELALARLDELPAPFPDFARFLRQLAEGQEALLPDGLPWEIRDLLDGSEGGAADQ